MLVFVPIASVQIDLAFYAIPKAMSVGLNTISAVCPETSPCHSSNILFISPGLVVEGVDELGNALGRVDVYIRGGFRRSSVRSYHKANVLALVVTDPVAIHLDRDTATVVVNKGRLSFAIDVERWANPKCRTNAPQADMIYIRRSGS